MPRGGKRLNAGRHHKYGHELVPFTVGLPRVVYDRVAEIAAANGVSKNHIIIGNLGMILLKQDIQARG